MTPAQAQYTGACERIMASVSRALKDAGLVDARPELIVRGAQLRNEVIRKLYADGRADGVKSEALIHDLGMDFYLSPGTVNEIIHKKIY